MTGFLSTILLREVRNTMKRPRLEASDAEGSFQGCHHCALHAGLPSESPRLACFCLPSGGIRVCHHTQLSTGS